jgi:hypothetical protein
MNACIHGIKEKVALKIKSVLPKIFGVAFDGSIAPATHFIAVFAVFPSQKDASVPEYALLALLPVDENGSVTASDQIHFLNSALILHLGRRLRYLQEGFEETGNPMGGVC